MLYCQGKTSARVIFDKETVISNSCPVKVECLNQGGQTGTTITVVGDREIGHAHHPGTTETETDPTGNSSDSYSLRLVTCSTGIGCGASSPNNSGEPYYQAQILKNGVYTGLHFGTAGWYSITQMTVVSEGLKLFKISNSTKTLYSKEYQQCPKFEVACDDDCPPGYMRCQNTNYPGYCCIPVHQLHPELIV